VRAVGGGVLAAVIGGLIYAQLVAAVRFGSLILAGLLGFLIGRVVRWGGRGQAQQPFLGIAMGLAGIAVAVAFLIGAGTLVPLRSLAVLAYPVAIWLAVRGLQS
jgi:hypothetical protein